MEQLLESGTQLHPSTTTGHVVTSETLTFLQAQKKQKVAKAADAETRGQALKVRRAELIVSHKAIKMAGGNVAEDKEHEDAEDDE